VQRLVITGGTGTLGRSLVDSLFHSHPNIADEIVILSRNEQLQHQMAEQFPADVRFVIGDVRDLDALRGVLRADDVVIHAAAIKHIDISEMYPEEAIKTNVMGAMNLVQVAKEKGISKLLAVSSDKACNPNSTYGTTKLLAERIFVQANESSQVRFANVRFGNLIGSSGSVFHRWKTQRDQEAPVTITDSAMTRFFMTAASASDFIFDVLGVMQGGEVFIPKIYSFKIADIACFMTGKIPVEIGLRLGEKLHEELISDAERVNVCEFTDYWVVEPSHPRWSYTMLRSGALVDAVVSSSHRTLEERDEKTLKYALQPSEFRRFLLKF
jgi:UDP-N-acetylglucosamine 4,6-dehydratase